MNTELVKWDKIKLEIAECQDIIKLTKLSYSLDAIQKWSKQSGQSLEAQNEIAEYRLRLDRKRGQWIEENIPKEGGNPTDQLTKNSRLIRPTLIEAGIDRNDSPKLRAIASVPEDDFEEHIAKTKAGGKELTSASVYRLSKSPHVSHNSGENEWYTPEQYIIAARNVMGSIDCDPASSKTANKTINATTFYTHEDDGLTKKWRGNVWMNPPYSQPLVKQFCDILVEKYNSKEIKQACVLINNATETSFFQNMLSVAGAICFIRGRVKFIDKNGISSGAPLQGQSVLYFGKNKKLFFELFSCFGGVLKQWQIVE